MTIRFGARIPVQFTPNGDLKFQSPQQARQTIWQEDQRQVDGNQTMPYSGMRGQYRVYTYQLDNGKNLVAYNKGTTLYTGQEAFRIMNGISPD